MDVLIKASQSISASVFAISTTPRFSANHAPSKNLFSGLLAPAIHKSPSACAFDALLNSFDKNSYRLSGEPILNDSSISSFS